MRTTLVTGADRGIGAAMCRQLAARGECAIAACLEDAPELRAQGVEVIAGVDVTSAGEVARLASLLAGRRIDVLVHNAGLVIEHPLGAFDFDAFHAEYAVNTLGPLRVTRGDLTLPSIRHGSRTL